MDFIKGMYEDGLVEKKLDEDAWANIRARRIDRLQDGRKVALYGYLVGVENTMKTKNFVELANNGKGIPSSFVRGYYPIVELIDDIVDAGPAYISMLKNLHQRAKRSRK